MCCPLGSETEVTQGHTPAATGEKSSQSIRHGSAKQPHRSCSSFKPEQTKLRAQLLLQLQKHLQAHLPLRKKLLWLLVQRPLSYHNRVEMQSLTWWGTGRNYTENLTFKLWIWLSRQQVELNMILQGCTKFPCVGIPHNCQTQVGVFKWGRQVVWITGGPQDYPQAFFCIKNTTILV